MDSYILTFQDDRATDSRIAGGKGRYLHWLTQISASISDLCIPNGFILTTESFDELIRSRGDIDSHVRRLDYIRPGGEAIKDICRRIEEIVHSVVIPADLRQRLRKCFIDLGANVAVRSSASCEDTILYAAAGRAQSYLNVSNEDALWSAILSVWASLYSERFVEYRKSHGLSDREARMAIVLQKMVAARVSGVVSSANIDARPGFNINAGFGFGAGVGNYADPTDWWFVGPDAKYILEYEANGFGPPVLNEDEVLKLSSLIKDVRRSANRDGNGHHINVEFAIDHSGRCFILQCRPDTSERSSAGKLTVKTVDEQRVAAGVSKATLKDAVVAHEGAASGVLQLLGDEEYDQLMPGVILVTKCTNNRWDSVFHKIAGAITTQGSYGGHAAFTAREYGLPCLVAARDAIQRLRPWIGTVVTLDARTRTVYAGAVPISEVTMDRDLWLGDADLEHLTEHEEHDLRLHETLSEMDRLRSAGAHVERILGEYWVAQPYVQYRD